MSVQTAPCSWEISYDQCAPPPAWLDLEATQRAGWEELAVSLLWRWTGRSLGLCEETLAPCDWNSLDHASTFYGGPPSVSGMLWRQVIINGSWTNLTCGRCGSLCSCNSWPSIALPGPIDSVSEVLIDGVALDPGAYRVDDARVLVRIDGEAWPASRGNEDTFKITYMRGVPVPFGGQVSAGRLAIELWKASCRDSSCQLPQRVQSITRQGVTVAVLDSFDDVEKGRTGIWLIDSWVVSMTYYPLAPAVYSVDVPRPRNAAWAT